MEFSRQESTFHIPELLDPTVDTEERRMSKAWMRGFTNFFGGNIFVVAVASPRPGSVTDARLTLQDLKLYHCSLLSFAHVANPLEVSLFHKV